MEEDDVDVPEEKELLHVLRKPDGSVFAALMLTPTMAEKINVRRRSKGLVNGDWKPEDNKAEFWYLDNSSKGFIKDVLPAILQLQPEVTDDVYARAE